MDYDIDIAIPGTHAWCEVTYAAIDQWIDGLARSEQAAGLGVMPAYALLRCDEEFSELQLSFGDVPGPGAWEALQRARSVVKLFAPGLLSRCAVRIFARKSGTLGTA